MSKANARDVAFRALLAVADDVPLDAALTDALGALDDPRERALARAIAFGTCRQWFRLCAVRDALLRKPLKPKERPLGILLVMGLHQLLDLRVPAHAAVNESVALAQRRGFRFAVPLVNAVLRRAARERDAAGDGDPTAQACDSHPPWLVDALRASWPDSWSQILVENDTQAPMSLRVNARLTSRDEYRQRLAAHGIAAHDIPATECGLQLAAACDVAELPGFADGFASVQDGAAQLAAPLLAPAPGQRVLDACAAPGGKTAHLLERQPQLGEVVAVERSRARLALLEDTLGRLELAERVRGLHCDAREVGARFDDGHFDAILLDAPCTASGVIRRHPDIKLRRGADDVAAASALQSELLHALWPLLARGGTLLYATCSVLPAENEQVVNAFLAEARDAAAIPLTLPVGRSTGDGHQILPGDAGMDGFYYARLAKR